MHIVPKSTRLENAVVPQKGTTEKYYKGHQLALFHVI